MRSEDLNPISPESVLDQEQPYRDRKRTNWERFLDRFKPRSAAMRTTVLVSIVVFFSLWMSLWFFWRTLYYPEIKQHARYLGVEIELLSYQDVKISYRENSVKIGRAHV